MEITKDAGDEHAQWFYFRVRGAAGVDCQFCIVNAGKCSYPAGWEDYRAVASTDGEHWFRVPTTYESGELRIQHRPTSDEIYYAYFAPYSFARHQSLLDESAAKRGVQMMHLTETIDGRPLDGLIIDPVDGSTPAKTAWIVARQHPGETMAEWWMEGIPGPLARSQRRSGSALAAIHAILCGAQYEPRWQCSRASALQCRGGQSESGVGQPDAGTQSRGAGRSECDGRNGCGFLHRCAWGRGPALQFHQRRGGHPGWTPRLNALTEAFKEAYEVANPDFQRVYGYPLDKPGEGNLTMCSNQVAERFDCLATTLEMPFKDNANAPDAAEGWSPERSRQLGRSVLEAIDVVLDRL